DVSNEKAIDATSNALSTLNSTVTQQGKDITSNSNSITSLSNQMVNGRQNMWVRSVYNVQLANNTTEPTFSDINGKAPISIDEVPDAAKLDFASAGSYVIAHYKAFVKVNADTTITIAPGSRVFDDTGAVYVNGVRAAFGNSSWNTVSFDLKAGWNTVEFLVNQWTGQAYINLGFKLSEKVAQLNSALGMNALSNAISAVTSNVSTVGDRVTSTSQSVTDLRNSLEQTNANLANKADAQALSALQNTVTQQGKDIASASSSITSLQNNLITTNANVAKKADATALNALQNTVTSQGDDLTSQGNRVTSLENTLTVGDNIVPNSAMLNNAQGWGGHATTVDGYPAVIDTAAWAPTSPKFSVTPGDILDFSLLCLAGAAINGLAWGIRFDGPSLTNNSVYVEALNYAAGEKKAVTGTITVPAGATTGYLQPYSRNAITLTIYNIKVTRRNAGTIANAKAIADLTNEVTQQGKDITSASSDISLLKNSLATTDANVAKKADSSALSSLQSTVNQQGTSISSIGNRTTSLENGLSTAQNNIARKADASALQDLRNTVTQQGKDLSSASGSVTELKSSLNTLKVQSNPWIDGTFETYDNNQQLGGSTAVVTTDFSYSGSKCLKVTRPANTSGNADKSIGSYSVVRQSAKYRVEFWAMMPASEAPPSGWSVVVGLHSINKDGGNDWQGITFNEAGLGGRDQWVKFTGVVKVSPSVTRSHVWISTRGQSGSNTPGYAVYIDDFVITDITDAADAQATADANATAISSLQTKVSDIDGKVTAQTSQLSSMQSKVDASSSKVDQLSKTISDSQSTQASLNTSLQSQIDAQASANIKNQTELNNATTSLAAIKSTQQTQATTISALSQQQTNLTAQVGGQSAELQELKKTVVENGNVNSTWMVKMETNSNGKKYAAGIALGIDGKNLQSQFLVQADRFGLINTSNGNTTTPFVIENGVAYMNAAVIKDGSITNAKIGGEIRSDNFVNGSNGWRIGKDGSSQFNNVVIRGEVHANTGVLNNVTINENCTVLGTVQANKIVGDVVTMTDRVVKNWPASGNTSSGTRYLIATIDGMPFERRMVFNGSVVIVQSWRQNVTIRVDETTVWTFDSGNDGKDFETSIFSIRIPASNFGQRHQITIQWPNRGDSGQFRFTGVVSMYRTTGSISLA
ncbi:TPA: DUF1983 domain-containing protein, partial [Klebsiella pneumoniae]